MDKINDYIHCDAWDEISYPWDYYTEISSHIISSHTLGGIWLLTHAEIQVTPCLKGAPGVKICDEIN